MADFHKSVYENRPIYFPLSYQKKSYVVWCNIHQWHDSTLQTVLAEFLMPEKKILEMRLDEMRKIKYKLRINQPSMNWKKIYHNIKAGRKK